MQSKILFINFLEIFWLKIFSELCSTIEESFSFKLLSSLKFINKNSSTNSSLIPWHLHLILKTLTAFSFKASFAFFNLSMITSDSFSALFVPSPPLSFKFSVIFAFAKLFIANISSRSPNSSALSTANFAILLFV